MGFFDFLFGKGKKEKQDTAKPNISSNKLPQNSFLKSKIYKIDIVTALIEEVKKFETPNNDYSLNFWKNESNDSTSLDVLLHQSMAVGQGKVAVHKVNLGKSFTLRFQGLSWLNHFIAIPNLVEGDYSEVLNTIGKGLIDIIFYNIVHNRKAPKEFNSIFVYLNRAGFVYLYSYALEKEAKLEYSGQFNRILTLYRQQNPEISKSVEEEIKTILHKSQLALAERICPLYDDKTDLDDFIQFLKATEDIKRVSRTEENKTKLSLLIKEYKDDMVNPWSQFKLHFFCLSKYSGVGKEVQALLPKLEDKIDFDFYRLGELVKLFRHTHSPRLPISFLLKKYRAYLKEEKLDPRSYQLLTDLMLNPQNKTWSRSINGLLIKQRDNLYQVMEPELFELVHGGVFVPGQYLVNSDVQKIMADAQSMLSQVCTTSIVSDKSSWSGAQPEMAINGEQFVFDLNNFSSINKILEQSTIPYQMVKTMIGMDERKQNKYYSISLMNSDQWRMADSRNKEFFKININSNQGIKFSSEAPALSNSVKAIKKEKDDQISSNRFIHDIQWKDFKKEVIDQFEDRTIWYKIMHVIVSHANAVRGSAKWKKEFLQAKEGLSENAFLIGMETLVEKIKIDDTWSNKDRVKALRGVISACTFLPAEKAALSIEALLKYCYTKVTGIGPKSISGGSTCIAALLSIETKFGYAALNRIKLETKYPRLINAISDAIGTLEVESKGELSKIKEAGQNDFGFVNGSKIVEIEFPYFVRWTIKDHKAESKWMDEKGLVQKKTPKINDTDAKKMIPKTTKQLNEAIIQVVNRIEELYFSDIEWTLENWNLHYAAHSFVSSVIEKMLWTFVKEKKQTIFIRLEGQNINIEGKPIDLPEGSCIRGFHPFYFDDQTIDDWRKFYIYRKMIPPMNYFHREVFTYEKGEAFLAKHINQGMSANYSCRWRSFWEERRSKIYCQLDQLGKTVLVDWGNDPKTPVTNVRLFDIVKIKKRKPVAMSDFKNPKDIKELSPVVYSEMVNSLLQLVQVGQTNNAVLKGGEELKIWVEDRKYLQMRIQAVTNYVIEKGNPSLAFDRGSYELMIKGNIHNYVLNVLTDSVNYEGAKYPRNSIHLAGKKNAQWLKKQNTAYSYDPVTHGIINAIELLLNDDKVTNRFLSNWLQQSK